MANEAVGVVAKEATRNMLRMQMKTHTNTHNEAKPQQIAAQTRLDISMWMQSSQEPRPFKLSGIVRAPKTTLRLRSNLFHLDSFRSFLPSSLSPSSSLCRTQSAFYYHCISTKKVIRLTLLPRVINFAAPAAVQFTSCCLLFLLQVECLDMCWRLL